MVLTMTSILTLDNVAVFRGRHLAVSHFSYAIEGPGWYGIIGANGSGKTTLLQALAGRLDIASGSIIHKAIDVTASRVTRAGQISLAPDAAHLPDDLTPNELFSIIQCAPNYSTPINKFAGLWSALDIPALLNRKMGMMSSGMRQRVAIFAAFIDHADDIVILDEPFNWLDPLAAYDLKLELKKLADNGMIIISALHDVSTLAIYCTQGILMAAGKNVLTLDADSLMQARANIGDFERMMANHLRLQLQQ
jgi:ABC-2 type transport system ATP-binding protein